MYRQLQFFVDHGLMDELKSALRSELQSLRSFNVYGVMGPPSDIKIMSSRLLFSIKTTSAGKLRKVKCRYVPRGFPKSDYRSAYLRRDTDMCTHEGLPLALQKILNSDWLIRTIGYQNAYLQQDTLTQYNIKSYRVN